MSGNNAETAKRWREANPEKVKLYNVKYDERRKEWAKANPEKRKQYVTKYRLSRPPILGMLKDAQVRAKKKGLPYDLTREWAEERYTGLCELTGLPMVSAVGKGALTPFSPSLDKIDPALGYVQSNCRFVLHCVNCLKGNAKEDTHLYVIARALLEKAGGK